MSMNSIDFASLVTGFLTDYLPLQRCYSKNTILSYRDTLKLLLRYISMEKVCFVNRKCNKMTSKMQHPVDPINRRLWNL